jgi:hypothetical protein
MLVSKVRILEHLHLHSSDRRDTLY